MQYTVLIIWLAGWQKPQLFLFEDDEQAEALYQVFNGISGLNVQITKAYRPEKTFGK